MALIINADDLGMNESVNSAICEAFSGGHIDRTTLLVNMPDSENGMKMATQNSFADKVGLHLNLTSGRPLTEGIAKDPVMCNEAGEYTADFARNLKTRFFLPRATRANVEAELRAQFDRYRQLGGTLWHIDSHHHVHTDPSIWQILRKVIRDYPVTSVRLGRNMYRGGNPLMRIYKVILNASIRRRCGIRSDYFGSATDYAAFTEKKPYLAQKCGVEVMVHPVYDSEGKLSDVVGGTYLNLARLH